MRWISPRTNRWLRRLAWVVLTGCTLVLLAWWAGPLLIKNQLEARGTEALGRRVSVEAVAFKPWSLELTLSRLQVAAADGQSAQLTVESIFARAQWQSLWRLAPVVDALRIEAPRLQAQRGADGSFDWDDMVQHLAGRPQSADDTPPRFALYNLELNNGSVDFLDHRGQQTYTHRVRKLQLTVPALSSLESGQNAVVQPRLAFELNGTVFDSTAHTMPFAVSRKSEVTLAVKRLDLAPWLPYMPADTPLSLKKGVVDAALRLAFEHAGQARLSLSGTVTLSDVELAQRDGKRLLSVEKLHTVLKDVRPLEQSVRLESVEVSAPRLQVTRNAQGRLVLADSPATQVASAPGTPWKLELQRFALRDGTVNWTDMSTQAPVRWAVSHWGMTVKDVQWPRAATPPDAMPSVAAPAAPGMGDKPQPPLHLEASATVTEVGSSRKAANLVVTGQGDDRAGRAELKLTNLGLDMLSPYVQPYLVPRASGTLGAEVQVQWKSGNLQLAVPRVSLEKFALTPAQTPSKAANPDNADAVDNQAINPRDLPSWDMLEISDSSVDLGTRTATIGKVTLRKPNVRVVREEGGAWMFERWLPPRPPVSATGPGAPPKTPPAWKVTLADVAVEDGTVVWIDRVPAKRVLVALSAVKLQARSVALDGKTPVPVQVSAQVRSGRTDPGSLHFTGTVAAAPLLVQGALEARQLPLVAAQPYFVDRFNVELSRASANFKGQVRYAATDAGPALQVKGDASVDDLRANSVLAVQKGSTEPTIEELLNWKSMAMPGLDVTVAPNEPLRLKVREVALSDFFARLIIDAEGHLVLQDLVKPADTGPPASAAPTNASGVASQARAKSLAPVIDVGPVSIINGRVAFSDRFIKPNYSADLTALNGTLSRFRSRSPDGAPDIAPEMADLELKGRAEGSASLEIVGKVNPLATPLALDIRGKVRDLELSPLSSYAMKYAGYGIERGKLSVDVNYSIKPNGDLAATNKITLSQLTFGDKVEGSATNLPVKLVVALLSDSKGVIDLNLPISGSLKDPEFRMWPIVWKIVGNIFTKAITSPFSLFSGASDEEDLARVAFTPGTASLTPDAVAGLDKALKVLRDKPSLKTTIVGTASLEAERDAIRLDQLNGMLLAEKRRMVGQTGGDVAAVRSIGNTEYPALLKEVYRRADFKKPRNLIGMTRDVPTEEMRAFLLDNIRVDEDTVRALARNRAITVREYLTTRQLPSERIFLGNEELEPVAKDWKPQVELSVVSD